jgi:protein-S-isoprenylcysteine O-methyltransferase Ste14
MHEQLYGIATLVVAAGACLRGLGVVLLAVRTYLGRRRFASVRIDRGFVLTAPEPFLMGILGGLMLVRDAQPDPGTAALIAAIAGAALVVVGWMMVLWTFASWPAIFVGHALLTDHRLVTSGAYAMVRHPVYLGALLTWLGLGIGFTSPVILAIVTLYVIPAYLIYMRDEEAMLADAFGEAYRSYRTAVPMLIPRLARCRIVTLGQA